MIEKGLEDFHTEHEDPAEFRKIISELQWGRKKTGVDTESKGMISINVETREREKERERDKQTSLILYLSRYE